MKRRSCLFCPSTAKLTGEHLWSEWIGDLLGDRTYVFTRRTHPDDKPDPWTLESLSQTAKLVCGTCNNGWMSNLESKHAKPAMQSMILADSPVTLSPFQMASIAAFAFKSTIIAWHMKQTTSRSPFSLASRRRFAQSLAIPDGFQVWLSALDRPGGRVYGVWQGHTFKTPVGTPNGFENYVFTFGVGNLLIQSTTSRWAKHFFRKFSVPLLTQHADADSFAIPIWPNDGRDVVWPPSRHLSNEAIDTFCCRWKTAALPSVPFSVIRVR